MTILKETAPALKQKCKNPPTIKSPRKTGIPIKHLGGAACSPWPSALALCVAYAGEFLYFRILAMQTSKLETLQKRERNSSISFCFSTKQLLSSNYLYFLDSGNFTYRNELHSLDPSFLAHRLHNSSTPRSSTRRLPQNEAKYAYASLRPPANCLHPTMCRSTPI